MTTVNRQVNPPSYMFTHSLIQNSSRISRKPVVQSHWFDVKSSITGLTEYNGNYSRHNSVWPCLKSHQIKHPRYFPLIVKERIMDVYPLVSHSWASSRFGTEILLHKSSVGNYNPTVHQKQSSFKWTIDCCEQQRQFLHQLNSGLTPELDGFFQH